MHALFCLKTQYTDCEIVCIAFHVYCMRSDVVFWVQIWKQHIFKSISDYRRGLDW
jgi:hypothetical protein